MRTMPLRNLYKVIGSEPSPYTNKVYAYMRYKNIPFSNVPGWFPNFVSQPVTVTYWHKFHGNKAWIKTVKATMQVYSELLPEKVGWPVVPVLVTPDDKWIQDSEDIIHHLEEQFPDKKSSKYILNILRFYTNYKITDMNSTKFYRASRTKTETCFSSSPALWRSTSSVSYYALPLEFPWKSWSMDLL